RRLFLPTAMLSRKFTLFLGPVVVLLLGTAIIVIVAPQGALRDVAQIKSEDVDDGATTLRYTVFAVAISFVLLINISVLVLLRMAGMILRPVRALVEGTRQIALEHFEYRVELKQKDEFGQLALAFDDLAAK